MSRMRWGNEGGSGFGTGGVGFGYGNNSYASQPTPFSWFDLAANILTRELMRSPTKEEIEQRANELFVRDRALESPESRIITDYGRSIDIGLYGLVFRWVSPRGPIILDPTASPGGGYLRFLKVHNGEEVLLTPVEAVVKVRPYRHVRYKEALALYLGWSGGVMPKDD